MKLGWVIFLNVFLLIQDVCASENQRSLAAICDTAEVICDRTVSGLTPEDKRCLVGCIAARAQNFYKSPYKLNPNAIRKNVMRVSKASHLETGFKVLWTIALKVPHNSCFVVSQQEFDKARNNS